MCGSMPSCDQNFHSKVVQEKSVGFSPWPGPPATEVDPCNPEFYGGKLAESKSCYRWLF